MLRPQSQPGAGQRPGRPRPLLTVLLGHDQLHGRVRERRRPAGPWAPPDAVHSAARSCRPPAFVPGRRSPPAAAPLAQGGPGPRGSGAVPGRRRRIGRHRGLSLRPSGRWRRGGAEGGPRERREGERPRRGSRAARCSAGEAAQGPAAARHRAAVEACRAAAAPHGGGRPAASAAALTHHLRGLCRRPESILRRSLHFLAGEPWLSGGSSGRSSRGCGASPQPPLLSGWLEGWKPFCSSPPSSEQEAAGGGGPAGATGWARSCSPMAAASLPFVSRLRSGWPRRSLRSCRRPCPQLRALGMRRPPSTPPSPRPAGARRRRPARSALQRGGRRPPPGTRRPPSPG